MRGSENVTRKSKCGTQSYSKEIIPHFQVKKKEKLTMALSLLIKRNPKLLDILPEAVYALLAITPRNRYEDGKKTSEIVGYVYDCVNTGTYDNVRVLVEGAKKPLITSEELLAIHEKGTHVFVEFDNARIRPYYNLNTKQVEDSIKAEGVHFVESN